MTDENGYIEISRVYIDSNQKQGKHDNIDNFFKENEIEIIRKRLEIGDYLLDLQNVAVCVDTKSGWDEVGRNLFGKKDKLRFENTLQKAETAKIPLIILVESDIPLDEWKNPRNTYNSQDIRNRMYSLENKYEMVHFVICSPKSTPNVLLGFLTNTFLYEDEKIEALYREQEEWAARVKAAESTQQADIETISL